MKLLKRANDFFSDMPAWLFWVLFFLIPVFFTVSRIIGWDLWWHLSCGRYLWENGAYPSPDTFSFTPVKNFSVNSFVWLGDLFLYCIYKFGFGIAGLHVFKFLIISFPAFIIYVLSGRAKSLWVLFFGYMAIVGSLQMHSYKNAMFAMFFIPDIVWLIANHERVSRLLTTICLAGILSAWTYMHGYVQVGFVVACLGFGGALLDGFVRKDSGKIKSAIFFMFICLVSYQIVSINYPVGFVNYAKNLFSADNFTTKDSGEKKDVQPEQLSGQPDDKSGLEEGKAKDNTKPSSVVAPVLDVDKTIRKFFRVIFRGGDSDIIQEFAYPLDFTRFIYVKILLVFTAIYFVYLIYCLKTRSLSLQFFLPSIAVIYLSFGYIRTTPFPFLVALPLMVFDIFRNAKLRELISRWSVIPLLVLLILSGFNLYFYFTNNWYGLTGVSNTEPGIGIGNAHKSDIADLVLKEYPNDNFINGYGAGGLLIWKWYGAKKVYIDGRSIDYDKPFYDDYMQNHGINYVVKLGINKALFALLYDHSWYSAYLTRNWNVTIFDTNMAILEKPEKEDMTASYGKIPDFMGSASEFSKLQRYEKLRMGYFLQTVIKKMLIFGRLHDASVFYQKMEEIISLLEPGDQASLKTLKNAMTDIAKRFGDTNDESFSDLFVKIQNGFDTVKLNIAIAELYEKKQMLKEAVDFYSSIALSDTLPADERLMIADKLFEYMAAMPALKAYEMLISSGAGSVHELNKCGYLYYVTGQKDKAVKYFRQAVKTGPEVVESYINLAAILSDMGNDKEASAVLEEGLSRHPDNKDLMMLKKGK